jgi:hypothetical protein
MANIARISFSRVGKNDGCLCDKCGQYIRNIVSVTYTDGLTLNYGQDCFDKLWKNSRLTDQGKKLWRKALKYKKEHDEEYAKYINGEMTEENDNHWKSALYWNSAVWGDKTYDEFRQWLIDEWYPQRFKEDQERLERFKKVNFER